jgi:PAS domain S-box-containing protein
MRRRRLQAGMPVAGARWWRPRPSAAVAAIGVLVIMATVVSALSDARRGREAAIEAHQRDLANLARALSEHSLRAIQAVDVLVRETALDPAIADPQRSDDDPALFARLRRSIATIPQVRELQVLGQDGGVAYRTSEFPSDHEMRAGCDCFPDQRSRPSERTVLGRAFRDNDGQWTAAVAERIAGPGNTFLGTVVATLDMTYFTHFYAALALPPGSAVRLQQRDGVVLSSHRTGGGADSGDEHRAIGPAASATESAVSATPPLHADQAVPGTGLSVHIELDHSIALAEWRLSAWHIGLRTLLLSATVAVLVTLVTRELKRRERSEARLRESEERYALAMAGSNEGHWDWDLRARTVYLSARLLALLGMQSEERVADDQWLGPKLLHPEDLARRRRALRLHLRGRTEHFECEYRVQDPSGRSRWLLDRGIGLRDARGRVYRMAGAVSDITRRKLAEDERARLEQRLHQAEKLEALGTLAAGIAHDFGNVVGVLSGYAEMAAGAAPRDGALRRYADNLVVVAARARGLVDQVLAFGQSSAVRHERSELRAAVAETLELLRGSLPDRIRVHVSIGNQPLFVLADAARLHEVVLNLCLNAVQAMPSGGTLEIRLDAVQLSEGRECTLGTLAAGDYVRLAVQDTGSGISQELLPRIFEPFFTTKATGSGTGLGLAIVHRVVAAFGGSIDVASDPGRGTTFTVWLPRHHEEITEVTRGRGERVLLLANADRINGLEDLLAEFGYEPAGYSDLQPALDALITDPLGFDAIVALDEPPEIPGTRVLERLRELGKNWPVVLLRNGHVRMSAPARPPGSSEFVLTDPPVRETLAEHLAQALRRAR